MHGGVYVHVENLHACEGTSKVERGINKFCWHVDLFSKIQLKMMSDHVYVERVQPWLQPWAGTYWQRPPTTEQFNSNMKTGEQKRWTSEQ